MASVPNILSLVRLALAVAFPFMPPAWWWLAILAAGGTDAVDGLVARRLGVSNWIGGVLDSIADKAFVVAVLLTFVVQGLLAPWHLLPLLARDIAVAVIAVAAMMVVKWKAFRGMPARLPGKATTAAVFLMLIVLAIQRESTWGSRLLIGIAASVSIIAAVDYTRRALRAHRFIRAHREFTEPAAGSAAGNRRRTGDDER